MVSKDTQATSPLGDEVKLHDLLPNPSANEWISQSREHKQAVLLGGYEELCARLIRVSSQVHTVFPEAVFPASDGETNKILDFLRPIYHVFWRNIKQAFDPSYPYRQDVAWWAQFNGLLSSLDVCEQLAYDLNVQFSKGFSVARTLAITDDGAFDILEDELVTSPQYKNRVVTLLKQLSRIRSEAKEMLSGYLDDEGTAQTQTNLTPPDRNSSLHYYATYLLQIINKIASYSHYHLTSVHAQLYFNDSPPRVPLES